ncbi:MAG: helix-turn-helix transcriptional regulator [Clostridiales bacterium]|nr:helix-turn-helix transcriptional regulator [Clostridiales bacterium]MBQ1572615.1 helix-turn-helix transcriptional regulator [Clostridiales bacterium]
MTIGDVIKEFRKLNDLNLEEFGKMCGLSRSYISMLENNKDPRGNPVNPSLETIDKIATAIGVDTDALVGQIDQDVVINRKKTFTDFDTSEEEAATKWKFIRYCYEHASQEDKNKVLTILKVRERWLQYKEMESLFTD